MSRDNMICPKCKTFQPRAETCRKCGVIVAKLWTQQSDQDEPTERVQPADDGGNRALFAGLGVFALVALGLGAWLFTGPGDSARLGSMTSYLEASRDAQYAADMARERMEAAVFEAETGSPVYSSASAPDASPIDLDLDRLASELNAVERVDTVRLEGEDLRWVARSCASFTSRYFKKLRFGSGEFYPIPAPETEFHHPGGLDGRYRCEGDQGTVYTHTEPRTRDGISACWVKRDAPREDASRRRGEKRGKVWVRMKWDDDTRRWAIYTRADQREVDRGRIKDARTKVEHDIERSYGSREDRARERIQELIVKVEDMRQKLRIAGSDALQRKHARTLDAYTRDLKKALVEQRYTRICKTAALAALDAREQNL